MGLQYRGNNFIIFISRAQFGNNNIFLMHQQTATPTTTTTTTTHIPHYDNKVERRKGERERGENR
jgi:hypothetical protein